VTSTYTRDPALVRWGLRFVTVSYVVLLVASAGWVFDIYENQIFAVTKGNMLGDLLRVAPNSPAVQQYGDMINSLFLVGGAVGGVGFGMIADRFGRGRSMVLSILVYATFSALTAGAQGYATGLIGALAMEGVDLTNPEQLKRALRDTDLMQRVHANAGTQAAIEAGATLAMAIIGDVDHAAVDRGARRR